jgi:hypothetical protein
VSELEQCAGRWPKDEPELASLIVDKSSIVLLLCRAIAAYEDPPLGCAVLTLGFSMEQGRRLILAGIASESHLPQERFVECLQDFAKCMNCTLEVQPTKRRPEKRMCEADIRAVLASFLLVGGMGNESAIGQAIDDMPDSIKRLSSPLQSVREEETEVSDDSSVEKRPAKPTNKPSKRSRVE